jgi:tetratricopeptide (TPR) repeat protein
VAKGVFESNEDLILSDFDDRTTGGTLGETVTALFRIDLGQSTSVHLLNRAELTPALARMELDPTEPITLDVAMELAQREGVKAVVTGEVLPLGPGAVVSARLVAAGTGENMVALRETARTIDAVPEAVDRLSAQLRERIGESLRSIQGDPPLEEVTTGSLEALRKYVQAEWALDMGDVSTAEGLIHEAIALDSAFAMAYRKLGVILTNEGRDGEEAVEAFTRAYQDRSRLPDRERLLTEAAYHTYVTEEMDSAVAAYEGVLEVYPADPIAGNNLAVLYGEREEMEKAADLYIRAIRRGHAPAVSYTNAVQTLYMMGRPDSAQAVLSDFREEHPNHPQATQYAAAMASSSFDYIAAARLVEGLLQSQEGNPRWMTWGEGELGSYALIQGRLNEGAQRILKSREYEDRIPTEKGRTPATVLEGLGTAAIQLHYLQDPDGAVHTLQRTLAELESRDDDEPELRAHLEFARLFAEAGRTDRATAQMEAFRRDVPEEVQDRKESQAELLFVEGLIALSRGEGQQALELFREGQSLVPGCELCGKLEVGEAFEAASQPDSAIQAYESYLGTEVLFRTRHDKTRLHRAVLGLARSFEAQGQRARAIDYYLRQLDLWSGADPGLQPRVEALRARVMELRRRGG